MAPGTLVNATFYQSRNVPFFDDRRMRKFDPNGIRNHDL